MKIHSTFWFQAKGYPDVSTRVLLARLEAQLKVPVLAVVDADPHGIHIMCVYRFGTKVRQACRGGNRRHTASSLAATPT